MFGLLKPDVKSLSCDQKSRYNRFYCGLCHGVGVHVGHAWRGLHSYDAIFVAVVADALLEEGAGGSTCRCPMMPVVHKATHDPSSAAMRYAVGVQMLLGDQWLADKAVDGSTMARIARPVLAGPVQRGQELLDGLGVDLSELHGFEGVQQRVEKSIPTVEQAAEPTAHALGLVFARMASLPGAQPDQQATLEGFGRDLGALIYARDALEDLVEDAVQGEFNPCLRADGSVSPKRTRAVIGSVRAASEGARRGVGELSWRRNADLVQHTVDHLCERARIACERAEEQVEPSGFAALRRWVAQPQYVHAAAAILLFFTTFWANMGTSAQAAVDLVAQALPVRRVQRCPCDDCGRACDGCGKACDDCGKACDGCKTCGDGCTKGCDQCNDACNSCNNCCQGCGSVFAVFG